MIKVKIKDLNKVFLEVDKWVGKIKEEADKMVRTSSIYTRDEAVQNISRPYPQGAVDTGLLRASLSIQKDPFKENVYRIGVIGKRADEANRYSYAVEYGRKPGKFPNIGRSPQEGLWRWVLRHGWSNPASVKRDGKPSVFKLSKGKKDRIKEARSIAYAIAKKIEKKGIRPRPYLRPAYEKGIVHLLTQMDKHFK